MADRPNIAVVAALVGDPARAGMLAALKDDDTLTATELANIAGVAPNTASGHLARLVEAQLVTVERVGRHRYFRLASDAIAALLESLEAAAAECALPTTPARRVGDSPLRQARTCYDHLAGRLGVQLTWSLVRLGYIAASDDGFRLCRAGRSALAGFGIDIDALMSARRRPLRSCLDWSEQRAHLGGALGAQLFSRLCDLGWLRRDSRTRAVFVTPRGRQGLERQFHIEA
jgi:DNA-binding transcriptional ArsR family regulator